MKNLNTLIIIPLISLFFASCAIHTGMMTGNASLSHPNFKIVDVAVGTASTTKVFGIGGLKSDALVLQAKKNLFNKYPLKKGQALANVTVDFKRSAYFIVYTTKVTISADIVDFNEAGVKQDVYYQKQVEQVKITPDEEASPVVSSNNTTSTTGTASVSASTTTPTTTVVPTTTVTPTTTSAKSKTTRVSTPAPEPSGPFKLGEQVYIRDANKAVKAKIVQMKNKGYMVQVKEGGTLKSRKVNINSMYKIKDVKEFSENSIFNIDDIVKFITYGTGNPPTQLMRYGTVTAMGKKGAVVKYLDGGKEVFIVLPYKDLKKR